MGVGRKRNCFQTNFRNIFLFMASSAKTIQIVAPPLRHLDPLIPMRAPVIGTPNLVLVLMRERPLDGVGTP